MLIDFINFSLIMSNRFNDEWINKLLTFYIFIKPHTKSLNHQIELKYSWKAEQMISSFLMKSLIIIIGLSDFFSKINCTSVTPSVALTNLPFFASSTWFFNWDYYEFIASIETGSTFTSAQPVYTLTRSLGQTYK